MKTISFFLISVSMYACYAPRYVYNPPTQNIPLLNKKNDFEVSAFYAGSLNPFRGKGDYNRGFDLQAAWAVSNHFAVMLNENVRWEKNVGNDSFFPTDSSMLSYKKNFTEVGAGYFTSAGNNKKLQFQIFGGTAFGSSKIFDDFTSNNVRLNKYHYSSVTKIFIQPALIYSVFRTFSTALSSRFTEILFRNIRTNYTPSELNNYKLDSISISPVFFWEPAVNYIFSFKKLPVKLQLQGSITVLLNHRFVEHRTSNIAIGLIYNFPKDAKNKQPAPGNKVH